ncbi:MAG TPA: tRNA (adenosine(37)-N6)-threonylcarbamoyltransferase complex transferase subunit TsaD [Anaerolineales bacterium]|nr:tRNA (adenosine(37)-N6)-threonylcarbamoyltransferase complex transferase subunit TsaD [Anaerolineae bacterium]HIQ02554.1 tRNA (adenosine(37)-N6)-threonylcarbamoyltransferase complex transferase subunit TsaD [Anaerolineales bacterium]
MRMLGIETSCDETAAAVVADGHRILSNVVASQVDLHARYGGVFPEMASRAHIEAILSVIQKAMQEAHVGWDDLDAVAVTYGPGLVGSLLVGVNTAKGLALGRRLPLVPVNHLEAHIYAHWLEVAAEGAAPPNLAFPLLALIVSGGHTELILMRGHGDYIYLGGTLDDAAGEAFDKVGRLLGLPYPGGPAIEKAARQGNPAAFRLPRAWLESTYDFSFSGLKTAVVRLVQQHGGPLRGRTVADVAASFQEAVVDVLATKTAAAAAERGATAILLCGGVSANQALRTTVRERAGVPVYYPPPILCTDNAAMIAACGHFRFLSGERAGWDLDVEPGLRLV